MITFNCKITDETQVYDADTIKCVKLEVYVPELEFGAFIIRDVRVNGIDTPELRPRHAGRTKASLERERQASREARQAVVELLSENDNQFIVKNVKYGKYAGRLIGTVIVGDVNLSAYLIRLGHAHYYDGRTKPKWDF